MHSQYLSVTLEHAVILDLAAHTAAPFLGKHHVSVRRGPVLRQPGGSGASLTEPWVGGQDTSQAAAGARPPLRQQPLLVPGDELGSSQHRERSLRKASLLLNLGPGALCHLLPLTVSSSPP